MVIEINSKTCNTCLIELPIEDFYTNKNGIYARCKQCSIDRNIENRRNRNLRGPRRPKRKVSLYEHHTKLLSGLGPGIAVLHGRYVHTYREFTLYRGPWGCVLDGELHYTDMSTYDIAHVLHTRHMKLMRLDDSDASLDSVLENITQVRNSCGVPIQVRFAKSLVSLDQYFLWMDMPRKLLISEVADHLSVDREIMNFILAEKKSQLPNKVPPRNFKNSSNNSSQVIDNTSDIQFVEE